METLIAQLAALATQAEAAYQADRTVANRDIAYTWADVLAQAQAAGDSKSAVRRITQAMADAAAYHG